MLERKKVSCNILCSEKQSIMKQCFAEKQMCHVSTENSCVAVVRPSKDNKSDYDV